MKRLDKYAEAILQLIGVKEKERVWVKSSVGAKELLLKLQRKIIQRGAFADIDIDFQEMRFNYLKYSSLENLKVFSPINKSRIENCDKTINLWYLDDYKFDYEDISPENLKISKTVSAKHDSRLDTLMGVGGYFPTPKLAKNAKMEWGNFLDFFFGAVSVDLKILYDKYRWLEDYLNKGKVIKIQSSDTDLEIHIDGRPCISDESYFWNIPDGELFTSPQELKTKGYIKFASPQIYQGSVEVKDLYLEFNQGKVVKFSSSQGEDFFRHIIETDEGSSRLGEIGIGINPKIDRIIYNDLFDEKILGTIHIALGKGFVEANTKNNSAIHWDLIKDLRKDGSIKIDNTTVYKDRQWIK